MKTHPSVVRVAVPAPLPTCFDYLPPAAGSPPPGARVRVPFGRGNSIGVVVASDVEPSVATGRLKRIAAVLDRRPVIDAPLLRLLLWAADYYCHAPGEVIAAALPRLLRAGRDAQARLTVWSVAGEGATTGLEPIRKRAPRQAAAIELLRGAGAGLSGDQLREALGDDWRRVVNRLSRKGWVESAERTMASPQMRGAGQQPDFELSTDQAEAVAAIAAGAQGFGAYLLHGITGSGKTEVYLRLIEGMTASGRQALVLVPEIGLTPQLVERFRRRLSGVVVVMHSGLGDAERLAAWRSAFDGTADVIVGTRSAVFTPLPRPGLIVVDEEHDASYKQQDGFRYSARDLAVMRARNLEIPVVLGSATPSFESLHNADAGRYTRLALSTRPGARGLPQMRLIDMRLERNDGGLSMTLRNAMQHHLDAGGQVLLFLNRRGFAPAWYCVECGWLAGCRRCDARMTYHQAMQRLRCHHCGAEHPAQPDCPECEAPLQPVGQGTERIEATITRLFPDVALARIDRDSTRRRGELGKLLDAIRRGERRILIGTQMLTKGHHFPDVTLVGILDADQGLFGADPRSNERLAQLIVQVAGRAGRAERPGEVLIQTHCPQHPLLNELVGNGYDAFAVAALKERELAGWPPFNALALLRAEAREEKNAFAFLRAASALARPPAGVIVLGPAAAPMARRAGYQRAQLLVQGERPALRRFLREWTPQLDTVPGKRRVRWSLDVDPADLY